MVTQETQRTPKHRAETAAELGEYSLRHRVTADAFGPLRAVRIL